VPVRQRQEIQEVPRGGRGLIRLAAVLVAALVFFFLTVLSIKLAGHRLRLAQIREAPHQSLVRCSYISLALVAVYLFVEGVAALSTKDDPAGGYTRLVAWLPLYLLLVAQASFLRNGTRLPYAWLVFGALLLFVTLPPAWRAR